jgi:hypothetical protein
MLYNQNTSLNGKLCRIKAENTWKSGAVLQSVDKKNNKAVVQIINGSSNKTITVDVTDVWLQKRPRKRYASRTEVVPFRPLRYRKPIEVIGIEFTRFSQYGDFYWMIQCGQYEYALFVFNDNKQEFVLADPKSAYFHLQQTHQPGGGNAIIRVFQLFFKSIGMPTGPFSSLDEVCYLGRTAMDLIIEAFHRIIDVFIKFPQKDTLYFSVDQYNHSFIGLGIFKGQVGHDVINFISYHMWKVNDMILYKRNNGSYPVLPMK